MIEDIGEGWWLGEEVEGIWVRDVGGREKKVGLERMWWRDNGEERRGCGCQRLMWKVGDKRKLR